MIADQAGRIAAPRGTLPQSSLLADTPMPPPQAKLTER
jgi:hypothetical protein